MPGYGSVTIGAHGTGGASWSADAALYLDFWVSALPAEVQAPNPGPLYQQYADATGHSPPLREDAMVFWQSRNRYKSSDIAISVAKRYEELKLDVGVLVIGELLVLVNVSGCKQGGRTCFSDWLAAHILLF